MQKKYNPPKYQNLGPEGLIACYQHNKPAIALLSFAFHRTLLKNKKETLAPTSIQIKDEERAWRHNKSMGLCFQCVQEAAVNGWGWYNFTYIYQHVKINGRIYTEVGMKLGYANVKRISIGTAPRGMASHRYLYLEVYAQNIKHIPIWELVHHLEETSSVTFPGAP